MTLLLAIVYAAFISLGLPDAIVGASWPAIAPDLGADPAAAGVITIIVSAGTILSSFCLGPLLRRFTTVQISLASVAMTALALVGYGFAPSFLWLCLLSVPLGLGAGAIDGAINAFVALHYSAKHNNWLHACWGVGAATGPLIVGFWLNSHNQWRPAYFTVAVLQCALLLLLFFSRKQWKAAELPTTQATHNSSNDEAAIESDPRFALTQPWWKLPSIFPILFSFYLYCGLELGTGLWGATFLVRYHGISADVAAAGGAAFYVGITVGRFLSGFATEKWSNTTLLRGGSLTIVCGALLVWLAPTPLAAVSGLALIGFGCAPIYPSTIKETPRRLGVHNTKRTMGLQMGFAYLGSMTLPPVIGFLMTRTEPIAMPLTVLVAVLVMWCGNEYVERKLA